MQNNRITLKRLSAHNKRLKHSGLRPLDSQQVARRLGDSYVWSE